MSRIKQLLGRYFLAKSETRLPLWNTILLSPVVFAMRFHGARLRLRASGYQFCALSTADDAVSDFVQSKVLPYNMGKMWIINRDRTERLMLLLRAIRSLDRTKAKVLVIGPRNEAELMLLAGYGFGRENLTAIDLFSYSPSIRLMDMHQLRFPSESFDLVYSSFVITYSDDIPRALEEAKRVARKGALMAFAFEHLRIGDTNLFGKNNLSGGPDELVELFGGSVGHLYWKEDHENNGRFTASVIFRLRK